MGSGHEPEDGEDDMESEAPEPPVHPVPAMQGAFEESIFESTDESNIPSASVKSDADARRQKLLESKDYDDSWAARWTQKPTAQHHPLLKLMAQITFGLHLLQQQQAKSEKEVVDILQTHVNEVDAFYERTSEDFDLAIKDIEDRIRFLKLPMTHQDVFEIMLDDKKFRSQLLDGNEKIEKIIDRTGKAMNAALLDVQKSMQANKELGKYLDRVNVGWPREKRGISDVYGAMRGNFEGWKKYLRNLQTKGNNLAQNLMQLGALIGEMSRLAAAASRRNKVQSRAVASGSKSAPTSPGLRSKFSQEAAPSMPSPSRSSHSRSSNLNKPLPREPEVVGGARQSVVPKMHPVPFAERYERPRQPPKSPNQTASRVPALSNGVPQRPKTAGGLTPRGARTADTRGATSELAEFLKLSMPSQSPQRGPLPNPLRSNPPDALSKTCDNAGAQPKLGRSQSQGANLLLSGVIPSNEGKAAMTRSRSHGAMDILKSAEQIRTQPNTQPSNKLRKSESVRAPPEQKERKDGGHR